MSEPTALASGRTIDPTIDIATILEELDSPQGELPVEAIQAARQHRQAITPRLIEVIERARRNALDGNVPRTNGHFFALFLLTEFRAKEALTAIVEALSLPGDLPSQLFGDAIHEILPCALVSMAADRLEVIESMIRNRQLNEYVRWAAATSLAMMVAAGLHERESIVDLLRALLREVIETEDRKIALGLVNTLTDLYPEEAYDEIREAFRCGLVDEGAMNMECVEEQLAQGKESTLRELAKHDLYVNDTVEALKQWATFSEPQERPEPIATIAERREPISTAIPAVPHVAREPVIAPSPIVHKQDRVGRNDRCPCGSGKKFKRCCGAR